MSCAKNRHESVKNNILFLLITHHNNFEIKSGLSLVGHSDEAKCDTLLKSWNNTERAAEFPEDLRMLFRLHATMLRPFPVWASCWPCVAFQRTVSSALTLNRSQNHSRTLKHKRQKYNYIMNADKPLKQNRIYKDITSSLLSLLSVTEVEYPPWSVLDFLNVSVLPYSSPINVRATMRATTLFPFIFSLKNWVCSKSFFCVFIHY